MSLHAEDALLPLSALQHFLHCLRQSSRPGLLHPCGRTLTPVPFWPQNTGPPQSSTLTRSPEDQFFLELESFVNHF
jgi:hypothetical protein